MHFFFSNTSASFIYIFAGRWLKSVVNFSFEQFSKFEKKFRSYGSRVQMNEIAVQCEANANGKRWRQCSETSRVEHRSTFNHLLSFLCRKELSIEISAKEIQTIFLLLETFGSHWLQSVEWEHNAMYFSFVCNLYVNIYSA